MPIITAASIKQYFELGDQPTCGQFVDFIDTAIPTSGVAWDIHTALTTASATQHLNIPVSAGAVGQVLYDAATTAPARSILDVQTSAAYLSDIAALTPAQGDILYYNGTDFTNLGPGTDGQFLETNGAAANPTWSSLTFPKNHIAGLECSKTAADTLTVAAGECRDADDAEDMVLAASLAKDVSSAWAVGASNGSLDTGSYTASTLYYVWLIKRTDTDVVDVLTSTSGTEAGLTKPTSYDEYRLIGAFVTDTGPDITDFIQVGDEFRLLKQITDVSDSTMTADTYETATLSVPRFSVARLTAYATSNAVAENLATYCNVRSVGGNDSSLAVYNADNNSRQTGGGAQFDVVADGSSQVEYACEETAGNTSTMLIKTHGFTMLTRSNPK